MTPAPQPLAITLTREAAHALMAILEASRTEYLTLHAAIARVAESGGEHEDAVRRAAVGEVPSYALLVGGHLLLYDVDAPAGVVTVRDVRRAA